MGGGEGRKKDGEDDADADYDYADDVADADDDAEDDAEDEDEDDAEDEDEESNKKKKKKRKKGEGKKRKQPLESKKLKGAKSTLEEDDKGLANSIPQFIVFEEDKGGLGIEIVRKGERRPSVEFLKLLYLLTSHVQVIDSKAMKGSKVVATVDYSTYILFQSVFKLFTVYLTDCFEACVNIDSYEITTWFASCRGLNFSGSRNSPIQNDSSHTKSFSFGPTMEASSSSASSSDASSSASSPPPPPPKGTGIVHVTETATHQKCCLVTFHVSGPTSTGSRSETTSLSSSFASSSFSSTSLASSSFSSSSLASSSFSSSSSSSAPSSSSSKVEPQVSTSCIIVGGSSHMPNGMSTCNEDTLFLELYDVPSDTASAELDLILQCHRVLFPETRREGGDKGVTNKVALFLDYTLTFSCVELTDEEKQKLDEEYFSYPGQLIDQMTEKLVLGWDEENETLRKVLRRMMDLVLEMRKRIAEKKQKLKTGDRMTMMNHPYALETEGLQAMTELFNDIQPRLPRPRAQKNTTNNVNTASSAVVAVDRVL
jgi:hypothetical protein